MNSVEEAGSSSAASHFSGISREPCDPRYHRYCSVLDQFWPSGSAAATGAGAAEAARCPHAPSASTADAAIRALAPRRLPVSQVT